MQSITALIADDEPLLRQHLRAQLQRLWPDLRVVDEARNGYEVLELFDVHQPDMVFLDIQMPGLNGIEVARALARRAHLVFVTAFEQYAIQAFEQGAIDYLVKPLNGQRLADTVERLQQRLVHKQVDHSALELALGRVAQAMGKQPQRAWLQWIKASVGTSVRLIPVDQVAYIRAEEKYTLVAWDEGEALIRKSIRELAEELDPAQFVQTHRSVIVNLRYVREMIRGMNETAELHLHGRSELLPVSRSYLHHFRQM
ncbi:MULTISPECIES: LytTR family DNA-binding domain-containing protein [unclassified Duganella]|uniref:LytR/AlgR family response regulator transcription factor n=1 Tax=unclassified Duganella TaxID=2636909 RepID=UPI0006F7DECC|nr:MULTISPECIES: LytTR family DNA-binding domain-containing protein [unclassified Duganella]KQV59160.1 two-component system response regulator [Duganella sp. Root336D2]KRB97332.1 two-component system response regulator [Duganella sp. Root198D2]